MALKMKVPTWKCHWESAGIHVIGAGASMISFFTCMGISDSITVPCPLFVACMACQSLAVPAVDVL